MICNDDNCRGINVCAYAHNENDKRSDLIIYKYASTLNFIDNDKKFNYK